MPTSGCRALLPPSRERNISSDVADVVEVGRLFQSEVVLGKKVLFIDLWKSCCWYNLAPLVLGPESLM